MSADDIEIVPALLGQLVSELEPLLAEFVQPQNGRLGNAVLLLWGGDSRRAYPALIEFARNLSIAGVRLGPDRAVELFRGWLEGEPLRVREHAIIEGVRMGKRCDRLLSYVH